MTKPIQIRKEEVVRDIRQLASLTHQPITEVVAVAVRAELARARRRQGVQQREMEIDLLLAEFRALPKIGPLPTDEEFYDEDGFPK